LASQLKEKDFTETEDKLEALRRMLRELRSAICDVGALLEKADRDRARR
jgi:hypothetical protein